MASSSTSNNDEVATLYSLIDRGLVTPVKNQHDSKSCRVHAQLACLEAEYKNNGAKKELYDLSVHAVIDGDPGPANGDFSKGYSMERYLAFMPFLTTTENYNPNENLERGDFRKDQGGPGTSEAAERRRELEERAKKAEEAVQKAMEEAEQAKEDAQRAKEDAQQAREDAQQARQEAQVATQKSQEAIDKFEKAMAFFMASKSISQPLSEVEDA